MAHVVALPFPDVEPRTEAPNDLQRIETSPRMFGGAIAEGLQGLGAGAERAGAYYGEVAADDQTNQFMDAARKLLHGDPNKTGPDGQPDRGFFGLRGKAAADAWPQVDKQIDAIRSQMSGSLPTGASRLKFDAETRRFQWYMGNQISAHADTEYNRWFDEVEKNSITVNAANLSDAVTRGDTEGIKHAAADLEGSYVRRASRTSGNEPTALQAAHIMGQRAALETQIDALEPTNPAAALDLFNQNRGLLSGSTRYEALANRLQNQADKSTGRAAAAQAWAGVGGGARGGHPTTFTGGTDEALALIGKHEAANNYNVGYGGADLGGAQKDETGFPVWSGAQGPEGKTHAAGKYQFEPDTWHKYARQLGVKDFSPASQDKVAKAAYEAEGFAPWAPYNANLARAIGWKGGAPDTQVASAGGQPDVRLAGSGGAGGGPEGQRGIPSREDLIGRIPEGLSENAYAHAYTEVNKLYSHYMQATSASRAMLKQSINNGIPMLEDGREFNYSESQIRSLLPADEADRDIDLLEDAKAVGQQKSKVVGMTQGEALTQHAANQAILDRAPPTEYNKMKQISAAFDRAAEIHFKSLLADPAGYLPSVNPEIERARLAAKAETPEQAAALRAAGQPNAFEQYTSALSTEQDRIGVPKDMQHVLGVNEAPQMVKAITSDPAMAPSQIRQMEQRYASAWPAVWNDLATLGKLPAGYQALGVLDEANGEQLARGLAAGKERKALGELVGTQVKNDIEKSVRGAKDVQDLLASLRTEGATPTQVADMLGTINTLALQKQLENPDSDAAGQAVKAFADQYSFMPNGGARVPHAQFDAVSANAREILKNLKPENLTIPDGFKSGRPGMPTADDYARLVQSIPTWINTQGDSIMLMSGSPLSRIVRDASGQPITVKFDQAAPATPTGPQVPTNTLNLGP